MLLIEPDEVAIRKQLDVICCFAKERYLEKRSLDFYALFGYLQTTDRELSSIIKLTTLLGRSNISS